MLQNFKIEKSVAIQTQETGNEEFIYSHVYITLPLRSARWHILVYPHNNPVEQARLRVWVSLKFTQESSWLSRDVNLNLPGLGPTPKALYHSASQYPTALAQEEGESDRATSSSSPSDTFGVGCSSNLDEGPVCLRGLYMEKRTMLTEP